jgi:hypothetical protein
VTRPGPYTILTIRMDGPAADRVQTLLLDQPYWPADQGAPWKAYPGILALTSPGGYSTRDPLPLPGRDPGVGRRGVILRLECVRCVKR